jgi:uncharacterized repeat protein (TIGR03803 family)
MGAVFKLTPNNDGSWKGKVLHSFNGTDGFYPRAGLAFDSAGNLYGTTSSFTGTVFKLTPNGDGSWKEKVLHLFKGPDGLFPDAGLIVDSVGNLYGTTSAGGVSACENGCGLVFELTPKGDGTWKEKVLHLFNHEGKDGFQPEAGLIFDPAGNLYGTTVGGGPNNAGIVFELSPNGSGGWKEKVLHSFDPNHGDGYQPYAALTFDSAGNLYGTTAIGGTHGFGTVFKLVPTGSGSWKESVLHSFDLNGKGGSSPNAGLIFDSVGSLYGTTAGGGTHGFGTVFRLTPSVNGGWKETVMHSFAGDPGAVPLSGLIFDGHGSLYGTTFGDQATTFGSVFEISP